MELTHFNNMLNKLQQQMENNKKIKKRIKSMGITLPKQKNIKNGPNAFFAIQDRKIGRIIKGETAPIEFDRTIKQWVNEKDISRGA